MSKENTHQWQAIVKAGEVGFSELFQCHYAKLFGIGYRMCGDRELTKDALQSFFLYIWEKRYELREITNVEAYLKTAFYRKMLELLKERKRYKVKLADEIPPKIALSYETLLIQFQEKEEQQQELAQALAQLPDQQREMLELRFLKELSYDEIATQTGKSRQTIYNQIHTAIKKLRLALVKN